MRNTIFYQNLSKDNTKKKLFDTAYKKGIIDEFDSDIFTKLRKSFYGYTTGLLYVYGEDTTFATIGNKVHLLSHILENEDYEIVHGDTDSTRNIRFFEYNQEHLDSNSWIEVKKGNKTFVYDPFSLLKYPKELYYELENPDVKRKIPKSVIVSHPFHSEDDFSHISAELMLVGYIPMIEKKIKTSPYQDILKPEITRLKQISGYEDIVLEWNKETEEVERNRKR